MRGTVAETIRWKLGLYDAALGLCRQGRFPLARFLALSVDRLPFKVPPAAKLPVSITPAAAVRLQGALPGAGSRRSLDDARLRRALRLAQTDADIDLGSCVEWAATGADAWLNTTGRLLGRLLAAAPDSAAGEPVAQLAFHALALHAAGSSPAPARTTQLSGLLALTLEAAIATLPAGTSPSARLGVQLALLASPVVLGSSAAVLAARPLNAYRTFPQAMDLARAALPPGPEALEIDKAVAAVQRRLSSTVEFKKRLAEECFLECVRDVALMIVLKTPSPTPLSAALHGHASSSRSLGVLAKDRGARSQLLLLLDNTPNASTPLLSALRNLLTNAEKILEGNTASLGAAGDLEARAKLAAEGALLLTLDAHAATAAQEVTARLLWLDGAEADAAWKRGRCLQLSFEAAPPVQVVTEKEEAFLVIRFPSASSLGGAAALSREVVEPIRLEAGLRREESPECLHILETHAREMSLRGQPLALARVGLFARALLDKVSAPISARAAHALGQDAGKLKAVRAELKDVSAQLATLDGGPAGALNPAERHRLVAQRELLEDSLRSLTPQKVDPCGIALTTGPTADLAGLEIAASPGLDRARTLCATPGEGVEISSTLLLKIGTRDTRALADALGRKESNALTEAVRALARNTLGSLTTQIDRDESGWPENFVAEERLTNGGLVVTGAALRELEASEGALHAERELYPPELPARFGLDPQRFWVLSTDQVEMVARFVGRFEREEIWELVGPEIARTIVPMIGSPR